MNQCTIGELRQIQCPLFCSLPLTLALTVLSILMTSLPAVANLIPIEEEFVLAQQLHVDSSWSAIVFTLQDQIGLLDTQSKMNYEGMFDISVDPAGDFSGTYSGVLMGVYLSEPWEITYNSTMQTVLGAGGGKDLKFSLTSTGTWKKGPYKGKAFTDTGTLTEKSDNKADMDIKIETVGEKTISTTLSDLSKTKKDGKLTLTGTLGVKKKKLDLTFVLDQKTKKFTSLGEYGVFGIDVLKNEGTFTAVVQPDGIIGTTSFDLWVVPDPASLTLALLGLGTVSILRRRKALR